MNIYDDAPRIIIIPLVVNNAGCNISPPCGHNGSTRRSVFIRTTIARLAYAQPDYATICEAFPRRDLCDRVAFIFIARLLKVRAKLFPSAGKSPESELPHKSAVYMQEA